MPRRQRLQIFILGDVVADDPRCPTQNNMTAQMLLLMADLQVRHTRLVSQSLQGP